MKKTSAYLLLMLPFLAFSQETGVHFQHGLSWQQVKEKAKAENKYIFMDCFTTWCGPCREMATNIFPKKEAGDFMNKHYVNIKLQLDSTDKDNADVKAWYADAKNISDTYSVASFPTLLFFSPNGEIVHRGVGATQNVNEFIELASDALDSNKQYYTKVKRFENGNRDTAFLKNGANAALDNGDYTTAAEFFNQYLAQQKNIFTKENLEYAAKFTKTSRGKGFELFLNNSDKIDSILGKGASDDIVMPIIADEEVFKNLSTDSPTPNWELLKSNISAKYPQKTTQVGRMIAMSRIRFCRGGHDWANYAIAVNDYMDRYGVFAKPATIMSFAWDFYTTNDNVSHLKKALGWSKKAMESGNDDKPEYVNTYACLLYKLGYKQDAVVYEQKVISLLPESDSFGYRDLLDKMKKGEKTWY